MINTIALIVGLLTGAASASAPLPICRAPSVCPDYAAGIGALPATGGTITGNLAITGTLGVTGASTLGATSATSLAVSVNQTIGGSLVGSSSAIFTVAATTFGVGGIIGAVDYTQVFSTTTPAYPNDPTVFSTITLAANTFVRNHDQIVISCFGKLDFNTSISRNLFINIGGVSVSSRTATVSSGGFNPGWIVTATITKVGSNAQVGSGWQLAGGNSGAPNGVLMTLTESAAQDITCGAQPQAAVGAGSISFLGMTVEYKPGRQ